MALEIPCKLLRAIFHTKARRDKDIVRLYLYETCLGCYKDKKFCCRALHRLEKDVLGVITRQVFAGCYCGFNVWGFGLWRLGVRGGD